MKTKLLIRLIIFSLFLTATPITFAQNVPNDWNTLKNLSVGTHLFVKTFNGKIFRGTLASVNNDELELTNKQRNSKLLKIDVKEVFSTIKKSGKRGKIIGGIGGFLVGMIAGSAINGNAVLEEDYNWAATTWLPIGGAIGGFYVGKWFKKGRKKDRLVYIAK